MTLDQERWAEAVMVDRVHGALAPGHIAERVGALACAGDMAGVARWREIASRLDQPQRPEVVQ